MALKGKTTIQLFDGKTGELIQETHDENMITNAVSNILNPPDYVEMGIDPTAERSYNMLHTMKSNIADTVFRGVIICRDPIPEDANNVMLPWTNEEIGHAGISNTSTDATIGTYNSNESGRIENGNGYRHVWDFGTDKANGEISCVCMTTKDGGTNGYHNTYWELSGGGLDLNSNATGGFSNSLHYFLGRFLNDETYNTDQYKWFYMSKLPNGNIRLLGKNTYNCAIYEYVFNNPFSISVREDKPFCGIISMKKVIEVFPAPSTIPESNSGTKFFHSDYYYDCDTYNVNYVSQEEKDAMVAAWDASPQWLSYFPYVIGDTIHVVGISRTRIYHYTYNLATYEKTSEKIIETEVSLQNFNIGFNYVGTASGSPRYRWFYGAQSDGGWNNALGAIFWDNRYFAVSENPLINGEINTSMENYGQFRVFEQDGTATEYKLQYYSDSSLTGSSSTWRGFYVDEKSGTPLLITDGNSYHYIIALQIRKNKDGSYGWYRMRISTPNYGTAALYTYANLIKIDGMYLPLYAAQNYPYPNSSGNYLGLAIGIMKPCLTTINNLSSTVRKLDGQTMKITYDIVDE